MQTEVAPTERTSGVSVISPIYHPISFHTIELLYEPSMLTRKYPPDYPSDKPISATPCDTRNNPSVLPIVYPVLATYNLHSLVYLSDNTTYTLKSP